MTWPSSRIVTPESNEAVIDESSDTSLLAPVDRDDLAAPGRLVDSP